MVKTFLIGFLSLFFILHGINHLWNKHILEEYARKQNLILAKQMVFVSGLGLITGGGMLLFTPLRQIASLGLAAFVLLAAVLIHRFWSEEAADRKMMEAQNFVKNLAIAAEMIYLGLV